MDLTREGVPTALIEQTLVFIHCVLAASRVTRRVALIAVTRGIFRPIGVGRGIAGLDSGVRQSRDQIPIIK